MKYSGLSDSQVERVESAFRKIPFVALLGIQLDAVEPGFASLSLNVRDELRRDSGVVHGGAIATLIDTAAAFAVIPLLGEDEYSVTVDLTISYLRPLIDGTAKASARVLRQGSRLIFLSVEVHDESASLAATGLTTYLRLRNSHRHK
jgi:uncharacterized protein (TIGR00369 family)